MRRYLWFLLVTLVFGVAALIGAPYFAYVALRKEQETEAQERAKDEERARKARMERDALSALAEAERRYGVSRRFN